MTALRYGLWAAVVLAVLTAGIVMSLNQQPAGPRYGAPFVLTSATGEPFDSRALHGHPHALFFGFTHCPDICPSTLAEMTAFMAQLGPDADRLKVVFISVDPERDTPAEIKEYLSNFDKRIAGLTGTPADIAKVTRAYGIVAVRQALPNGGYTMDHSAGVLLIDGSGQLVSILDQKEPPAVKLAKLQRLLGG